jgi:hypothetical protein
MLDAAIKRNLHLPVAGLLLAASFFKSIGLRLTPNANDLSAGSEVLMLCLVLFELWFAVMLLATHKRNAARIAGLILFSAFFIYAMALSWQGAPDCGCFGVLSIPPAVSAWIDASAIICLWFWKSRIGQTNMLLRWVAITSGFLGTLLVIEGRTFPAVIALVSRAWHSIDKRQHVIEFVHPDDWLGIPWPPAATHSEQEFLLADDWLVLLYKPDCKKCDDALQLLSQSTSKVPLVVIEMGESERWLMPTSGRPAFHINVGSARKWYGPAPVLVVIRKGVVIEVIHDQMIAGWLADDDAIDYTSAFDGAKGLAAR